MMVVMIVVVPHVSDTMIRDDDEMAVRQLNSSTVLEQTNQSIQ